MIPSAASEMVVQPDLFGEYDATQAVADDLASARAALAARFERRDFPSPYDTAICGAGEIVHGWVCPACGGVEWNEFLLNLNHGYQTYDPKRWPGSFDPECAWGDTCTATMRREYRETHASSLSGSVGVGKP